MSEAAVESAAARLFREQADICDRLGSPYTAALLRRAVPWLAADHPAARKLRSWPGEASEFALGLRFAGAVHALALSGRAPELNDHLARLGTGGDSSFDIEAIWRAAEAAMDTHPEYVAGFLDSAPQTNEVGRAAMIMAASLELAHRHSLPFHVLEAGASAGLNLAFDRHRYRLGNTAAGPEHAPLCIRPEWRGASPPDIDFDVHARRACDLSPVEIANPEARLRLRAYVWPDQPDRLARLEAAIAEVLSAGISVERALIGDWLAQTLPVPRPGCLTLLFHTVVWAYLGDEERARAEALIADAGRAATEEAPFARLAVEWNDAIGASDVSLTVWPGGETRLLGTAHAHGTWVDWKGW